MAKMMITGATGALGGKVAEYLAAQGFAPRLAAGVREPDKAGKLKALGVELRRVDYDDPASLEKAFTGIERLLLISSAGDNESRIRQHLNAVAAAKQAGVKLLAYTSVANADSTTLWLAQVHQGTEKAIRDSGIPFVFLRNNWYLENESDAIRKILAGRPLVTASGEGKVGWATRAEYAEAAMKVLAGRGHENKVYELSGPATTYAEFAAALSKVIGREVKLVRVDDAALSKGMVEAGLPDPVVRILVSIQSGIRKGSLESKSKDFETVLGRPLAPLKDSLDSLVEALRTAD